jgi:hypothetical protein
VDELKKYVALEEVLEEIEDQARERTDHRDRERGWRTPAGERGRFQQ